MGAGVVGEDVTPLADGVPRALACAVGPDRVLAALDRGLLTAAEDRRLAALRHPADRDAYVAAHLLIRWCAAELTGRPMERLQVEQRCPDCGSGEHGRPGLRELPGVHVSLSRTRHGVAAAAGWDAVAVDVESVSGDVLAAMPVALSVAERRQVLAAPDRRVAFLRHWVRKECLVKIGATTLDDLRQVDLAEVEEEVGPDGRARGRYRGLHMVDWIDPSLDVMVAVAAAVRPAVRPFRPVQK
ncbi:4'-phosphopantetheinyl transferase superfamily protein [Blastococcus sp. HT6-30]|uniref:4'-phosphopantetheinyl transferase family protein n=1 Tax=Blastococcus sp. HT6-30 TaxID=3144843 RepID=UPI00321C178A